MHLVYTSSYCSFCITVHLFCFQVGAMCIMIPKFIKFDPAMVFKLLKKHNTSCTHTRPQQE